MKYLVLILALTSFAGLAFAEQNFSNICSENCKNLATDEEPYPRCVFDYKFDEQISVSKFTVNAADAKDLIVKCETDLKAKYETAKAELDKNNATQEANTAAQGKTCDVELSNNLFLICDNASGNTLANKGAVTKDSLTKICDAQKQCNNTEKDANAAQTYDNIKATCTNLKSAIDNLHSRCKILVQMYSTPKFNISDSDSDEVKAADPQMGGAYCKKGEKKASSDFQSCKKLVNSINASYATAMATQVGGQVNTAMTQVKIQKDLKEDDGKTHTKLMDAAKDNLTAAKNNAWAEEGVYLGSASLIGGIIANYPTPKAAAKWCRNSDQQFNDTTCNEVFNDSSVRAAAFNNQSVLDNAKTVLTSAIAKAAVKGAEIWALQKQLDSLSDVEEGFKKLDETSNGPNFADLQVSKCQVNPQAPECQQIGDYIGPPSIGSLNFGDGTNGVIDPNQVGGTDFNGGGATTAGNTTGSNADGSDLGPLAIGGKSQSGGLMGNFSAPGLKPFNYAAGGTGGGGGGGGGGAGGGGKGAGAGADSGKMNIGSSGLQFSGPGSFTIGGKKGKGGDENPFDKLVKKDDKGDGDMDFRAPASAEDASKGIFVRISERYQKVNQAKKLLEYETK